MAKIVEPPTDKVVDPLTGKEMANQHVDVPIKVEGRPATVIPTVVPEVTPPVTPPNTPEPQPAKYNFKIHKSEEAHKSSGLHSSIAQYLEPDYIKEVKDLPEMDKIKLTDFFNKKDWKPEELKDIELGDASIIKMKTLFPDIFPTNGDSTPPVIPPVIPPEGEPPVVPPESGVLEDMDKDTLITEYNKLKSETDTKFNTLRSEFDTFKSKTPGEESAVLRDFEGLKTDFLGTYKKLQEKYGLPSIDLVRTQFTAGSNASARLQQYQETELPTIIEKEFSLQAGEFDYESNEASKAGTASFRWDELSNTKKSSLTTEQENLAEREIGMANKVTEQQTQDTKWYAEKHFEGDASKVEEKMNVMSTVMDAVAKGKESYEKHPFAMRNLLHGFYYEELKDAAVEKAVNELAQQFATGGMYLQGKEFPTDPTKISTPPPTHEVISKEDQAKSPMFKSIGMTLNTLNKTN